MPTYRIDSPTWCPAKLNEMLAHWATRAKLKRRDREALAILGRHVPPAVGPRRVQLTVVLGRGCRGGDPDAYAKSLLDALVACRLLIDDRNKLVEWMPVKYERGTQGGCVIELEDLPPTS
jgi:hypothetical protein